MRMPQRARPSHDIVRELMQDPQRLIRVMSAGQPLPVVDGKYLHWDQLRHRKPPKGLTLEDWWARIKFARGAITKSLPLRDAAGVAFKLACPEILQRKTHEADRDFSGRVELPGQLTTPGIRDRYLMNALIDEAISSSQLEGAATTRRVANEMLRSGRQPRNNDERMIFNNFKAMQFVRSIRKDGLTPKLVFAIHSIVTDQTLPDPSAGGRLRTEAESPPEWGVWIDDTQVHKPPPAEQLPQRLRDLCAFANDSRDVDFIHPIVRSVLLHFWLGYDHPFVDGNGRTARALFYWSMLHHGYWLAEYLSISHILHKAPVSYSESYIFTETDENDTTYFVLYQIDVLLRAIEALLGYVTDKAQAVRQTEELMKASSALNHRQVALLGHALCNPEAEYSVTRHATSHRVTRQTARTDLRELAGLELLAEARKGRAFVFKAPADLERKLADLGQRKVGPRGPGRPPRISNQRTLFKP